MSLRDEGIIQFNGSPEHFELLFDLEKSLDYKVKEFVSHLELLQQVNSTLMRFVHLSLLLLHLLTVTMTVMVDYKELHLSKF